MEPLSPRAIQARVRAGESPEVIAAETGWPLDRVERYAEPPLAERAFIASQAQAAEVRRSGEPVLLADTVGAAMARAGRTADEVDWDAWRREDGRWIVTATTAGATATWTYDVAGRTVHPLDDSARRLMGVDDAPEANPRPAAAERPRLVAVPEPQSRADSDVVVPAVSPDPLFDPDPHDTLVLPRDVPAARATERATGPARHAEPEAGDQAPVEAPDAAASKPAADRPVAKKGRGRRASVPSWDEILFGNPGDD